MPSKAFSPACKMLLVALNCIFFLFRNALSAAPKALFCALKYTFSCTEAFFFSASKLYIFFLLQNMHVLGMSGLYGNCEGATHQSGFVCLTEELALIPRHVMFCCFYGWQSLKRDDDPALYDEVCMCGNFMPFSFVFFIFQHCI